MQFEGIYPPVVTPFTANGDIDKNVFADVLEFLLEKGVHGIIMAGSTGEYYAETEAERIDLARYAKDVINGRVPLIVGTGATRTEEAIRYAEAAKAMGADAIMISSPPYATPTSAENAAHALAVDQAAGLPVMLYNYPARMSVHMDEDFLATVSQSKRFMAIKEASGDINRLQRMYRKFPHIALSCGWDPQALEFFAWGARSWVCGGGNCLPQEHLALYEACVIEGDFAKGRKIMAALMPFMEFLDAGKFVQSIKYGCELAGLPVGPPRRPMGPLDDAEKDQLKTIIHTVKQAVHDITHNG